MVYLFSTLYVRSVTRIVYCSVLLYFCHDTNPSHSGKKHQPQPHPTPLLLQIIFLMELSVHPWLKIFRYIWYESLNLRRIFFNSCCHVKSKNENPYNETTVLSPFKYSIPFPPIISLPWEFSFIERTLLWSSSLQTPFNIFRNLRSNSSTVTQDTVTIWNISN